VFKALSLLLSQFSACPSKRDILVARFAYDSDPKTFYVKRSRAEPLEKDIHGTCTSVVLLNFKLLLSQQLDVVTGTLAF